MSSAILSSQQMKEAEKAAAKGKTQSFTLMQRAGKAVADEIGARYEKQDILVLCGPGNNGGDGFIAAAALKKKNWPVTIACAVDIHDLQGDASRAAEGWNGEIIPFDELELPESGLIVDAVFGTGLSRDVDGVIADLLVALRECECPVIAIDLPSGAEADTGMCQFMTPQAELTITFGWKKPAHVLMPARLACGEIIVADIGIGEDVLEPLGPFLLENSPENGWGVDIADKSLSAHKYDHGHVVVLGGRVMTGAGCLASVAALRAGAGLVSVVSYPDAASTYRAYCPSLMVETISELARFKEHLKDIRRNVVLMGPGAGQDHPAALKKAVFDAVQSDPSRICVLDADALTVFADDHRTFIKALGGHCILTPHEGEFARIFPDIDPTASKLERAYAAARKSGAVIVLKGADTVIASPDDRMVVNTTGTGWLATAGTGDVLAGMIAGLAARRILDPFDAACAAVWLHGKIAENYGPGLISADMADKLPEALKNLFS